MPNPRTATSAIPLTVAGSDPSGGAGIEGDLKTFLSHGLSGAAVITALTDQDSSGVHGVTPVPEGDVQRRLERILNDLPITALKTGLLPSSKMAVAISDCLSGRRLKVVVDPVIAPTRGSDFLDRSGIDTLRSHLLPLATLVTPNLPELATLVGASTNDVMRAPEGHARKLLETGVDAVLLKGGHIGGPRSDDLFVDATHTLWITGERVEDRRDVHGTGCALSAAIVCGWVHGAPTLNAVEAAKTWLAHAIRHASHPNEATRGGARRLRFGATEAGSGATEAGPNATEAGSNATEAGRNPVPAPPEGTADPRRSP